jgi:hypothetical protein
MAQKMQEALEEAKEKFGGKSDERNQQSDQRLDGLELKFSQIAKHIENGGMEGAGGTMNRLAEQQRVFEERITTMTHDDAGMPQRPGGAPQCHAGGAGAGRKAC